MKRLWVAILMVATLAISELPNANAAVTPGSKCSKAGIKQDYKGKTYTCIKSGNKLVWDKGIKVETYDAAFAAAFLAEAQDEAAQILADAKLRASQISRPPNCAVGNSQAFVSFGTDPNLPDPFTALIYENPGICVLVVRATAEFDCPGSVTVISRSTFTLKAREKIFVSWRSVERYFPLVKIECQLLTGKTPKTIGVPSSYLTRQPTVIVESSKYSGVFNQAEATKKANQVLKSAQSSANQIIADAKNPVFIRKAAAEAAERAAAEAADLLAAAEAAATGRDAIAAAEKRAADLLAAAEKLSAEKAAADAKEAAENAIDEALGKACVVGGSCKVGRTGPGGGIVFYAAGTQQSWGRYLEFAPSNWSDSSADISTQWCEKTDDLVGASGQQIGTGKANTDLILKSCTSGAAVIARAYKGGGKDDWFLPSKGELSALYAYDRDHPNITASGFGGRYVSRYYWSSSESGATGAWWRMFRSVFEGDTAKVEKLRVYPIRAF